jgi:predicted DNA-binding protein (MmcQ/YjbR family)
MVASTKPKPDVVRAEAAIAQLAQVFPGVTEEHPWGHRAFKVRGKTFLFLGADASGVSFSLKLPASGIAALALDFTEPTHYGLGKSGWVTARFARERDVPLPLVREWLEESYRAIAPAKLAALLDASAAEPRVSTTKRRVSPQGIPRVPTKAKKTRSVARPSADARRRGKPAKRRAK